MKRVIKIFAPLAALLAPLLASAQSDTRDGLSRISRAFGGSGGLSSSTNVVDFIVRVIEIMLFLAGAIAVLFVIIGGFWYLTSAGNEEQAEKGKNAVVNAIIGIVIIILSYVIINVVVGTINRY